eukprot:gene27775-7411_t
MLVSGTTDVVFKDTASCQGHSAIAVDLIRYDSPGRYPHRDTAGWYPLIRNTSVGPSSGFTVVVPLHRDHSGSVPPSHGIQLGPLVGTTYSGYSGRYPYIGISWSVTPFGKPVGRYPHTSGYSWSVPLIGIQLVGTPSSGYSWSVPPPRIQNPSLPNNIGIQLVGTPIGKYRLVGPPPNREYSPWSDPLIGTKLVGTLHRDAQAGGTITSGYSWSVPPHRDTAGRYPHRDIQLGSTDRLRYPFIGIQLVGTPTSGYSWSVPLHRDTAGRYPSSGYSWSVPLHRDTAGRYPYIGIQLVGTPSSGYSWSVPLHRDTAGRYPYIGIQMVVPYHSGYSWSVPPHRDTAGRYPYIGIQLVGTPSSGYSWSVPLHRDTAGRYPYIGIQLVGYPLPGIQLGSVVGYPYLGIQLVRVTPSAGDTAGRYPTSGYSGSVTPNSDTSCRYLNRATAGPVPTSGLKLVVPYSGPAGLVPSWSYAGGTPSGYRCRSLIGASVPLLGIQWSAPYIVAPAGGTLPGLQLVVPPPLIGNSGGTYLGSAGGTPIGTRWYGYPLGRLAVFGLGSTWPSLHPFSLLRGSRCGFVVCTGALGFTDREPPRVGPHHRGGRAPAPPGAPLRPPAERSPYSRLSSPRLPPRPTPSPPHHVDGRVNTRTITPPTHREEITTPPPHPAPWWWAVVCGGGGAPPPAAVGGWSGGTPGLGEHEQPPGTEPQPLGKNPRPTEASQRPPPKKSAGNIQEQRTHGGSGPGAEQKADNPVQCGGAWPWRATGGGRSPW